jgi:hypothetical protein
MTSAFAPIADTPRGLRPVHFVPSAEVKAASELAVLLPLTRRLDLVKSKDEAGAKIDSERNEAKGLIACGHGCTLAIESLCMRAFSAMST